MHGIGRYPSEKRKTCDVASANIDALFQKTQFGFITSIITNFLIFYHVVKFSFFLEPISLLSKFFKEKTHPLIKAGASQCHQDWGLGKTRQREDPF